MRSKDDIMLQEAYELVLEAKKKKEANKKKPNPWAVCNASTGGKKKNPKKFEKCVKGVKKKTGYKKKIDEAYSDSEFEDDQHVGSTNMPHGYGHPDRSPQDWDKTVHLDSFVDDYDAELSFPAFVTAYDGTRAFGGHEEGGWYYDAYEGLESVEVNSPEEAEQAAKKLYGEYKGTTDGRLYISIERTKNSQEQGPPHWE